MPYIRIKSLPKILFAHEFRADRFDNVLPATPNKLEITYLVHGKTESFFEGKSCQKYENDISCNTFRFDVSSHVSESHEHHTVGASVEFDYSDEPKEGFILFPSILRASERNDRVKRLIDEIIYLHSLGENRLKEAGLFLELLGEVGSLAEQAQDDINSASLLYVKRTKKYVYENLSRPITQREIAEHLHITSGHLCNVFKSVVGESVMTFINRTKLRKIKALMEHEGLRLNELTEKFGYTDPNYVSRLYKKLFGKNITAP